MSQFPRFRSTPRRRQQIQSGFSSHLRSLLALGLAALVFFAPLSFNVQAHQSASTIETADGKDVGTDAQGVKIHGFIIELNNGVAGCRLATAEELPFVMAPADAPRERITVHTFNKSDGFQANMMAEDGENVGSGGLTINFNVLSQLATDSNRAQVEAAFIRAAEYWTNRIKSPVTIDIDIDYGTNKPGGGPFGGGVLGSTGSASVKVDYPGLRHNLIAAANPGAAGEAALYNSLPTSILPTNTGNGGVVDVSASTAKALGIPVGSGSIASIAFNKGVNFDFDPSNGIAPNATDFTAVATHEIGHALGFVSGAGEGSTATPTIWDLFRFRPGTAGGNFTNAQRVMSIGGGDQVYYTGQNFTIQFVPGTVTELGLSTGGPGGSTDNGGDGRQSSHWKADEQTGGQFIGIMDPTLAKGETEVPTNNDYMTLEAIGWDLTGNATIPGPPPAPPQPGNDNFASAQSLIGCSGSVTGTNVGATKEAGEPNNPVSTGSTRSVWYQWQAPSTGNFTVDTNGSGFDTTLAVYTGNSLGGLSLIDSNDDNEDPNTSEHEVTSSITFTANQGTVYRIAVNGFNNGGSGGDIGNVKVNWVQTNCSQQSPTLQLNQASYQVSEGGGNIGVVVTRTDVSGTASVNYATSDTFPISQNCQATGTGIASSRCDYATSIGTLQFAAGEASKTIFIPIVDDNISDGNETFTITLSNPVGAGLGATTSAPVTIVDNANTAGNPIDTVPFFVRQHYIDLLGREPDPAGYQGWQDILNGCGTTVAQPCDRIEVSSAFFRSEEFQNRGYFVYRFYSAVNKIPLYEQFMPDLAKVSGFLSAQELENNKVAFVQEFMARSDYQTRYAGITDNTAYVDTLLGTLGLPNHSGRQGWINALNTGTSRAVV
ncbi:MAG TPA: NF038122 family metalloprotease, partial [Pyrinomonadaceae bacterium]|nr:NF038122 family metalloprotease [Pyrinomonadaceae bacterium]